MVATLRQFRWGAAQAGISLSLASSAWLLSGLTSSPLINSMLPALTTLPALLSFQRRASGYALTLTGSALLILLCSPLATNLNSALAISGVMLCALVVSLGQDLSQLPLQQELLSSRLLSFPQLRRGSELGSVAGFALTGLILPGWHQFMPAALLLLPLLPTMLRAHQTHQRPTKLPGFHPAAALQGLVFSGLFALLPLWIRTMAAGNCFNFGMVLMAYAIGRSLITTSLDHACWRIYLVIASLLATASISPGWLTPLLFLAIGTLATSLDHQLVAQIRPNDPVIGWQVLQRSGAIGGLAGVLIVGSTAQLSGLSTAFVLQIGLLLAAPALLNRFNATRA